MTSFPYRLVRRSRRGLILGYSFGSVLACAAAFCFQFLSSEPASAVSIYQADLNATLSINGPLHPLLSVSVREFAPTAGVTTIDSSGTQTNTFDNTNSPASASQNVSGARGAATSSVLSSTTSVTSQTHVDAAANGIASGACCIGSASASTRSGFSFDNLSSSPVEVNFTLLWDWGGQQTGTPFGNTGSQGTGTGQVWIDSRSELSLGSALFLLNEGSTVMGSQFNSGLHSVDFSALINPGLGSFLDVVVGHAGNAFEPHLPPVIPDPIPTGGWTATIPGSTNDWARLDPPVAIGYDYLFSGLNVAAVKLPEIGDNLYDLYLWNGTTYDFAATLHAGIPHYFGTGGIDRFRILGIEESAVLDPNDPLAFMTDVTFISDGDVTFSMIPITASVPEPSSLLLLGIGLVGLAGWQWRRHAGWSARLSHIC